MMPGIIHSQDFFLLFMVSAVPRACTNIDLPGTHVAIDYDMFLFVKS